MYYCLFSLNKRYFRGPGGVARGLDSGYRAKIRARELASVFSRGMPFRLLAINTAQNSLATVAATFWIEICFSLLARINLIVCQIQLWSQRQPNLNCGSYQDPLDYRELSYLLENVKLYYICLNMFIHTELYIESQRNTQNIIVCHRRLFKQYLLFGVARRHYGIFAFRSTF